MNTLEQCHVEWQETKDGIERIVYHICAGFVAQIRDGDRGRFVAYKPTLEQAIQAVEQIEI